jgi:hypothetical protein
MHVQRESKMIPLIIGATAIISKSLNDIPRKHEIKE